MIFLFDKNLIRMFEGDGKNAGDEWAYFLNKYSKIILKVIRSYTNDYDEVMDKYLFICTKLAENNFTLIRKYNCNDKRRAKLSTWLTVVVRNLCVDQFRHNHGRKRLPAVIKNMTGFERKIFKLYFFDGLDISEIGKMFEPNKSIEEIQELIDAGKHIIRDKQIYASSKIKTVEYSDHYVTDQYNIDTQMELEEINDILNKLIEPIEPGEKFILKLRFWEGLSAKEISSITNIPQRKIFYTLEKVIDNLRLAMRNKHIL